MGCLWDVGPLTEAKRTEALRLQDLAAGTCRRVLPQAFLGNGLWVSKDGSCLGWHCSPHHPSHDFKHAINHGEA